MSWGLELVLFLFFLILSYHFFCPPPPQSHRAHGVRTYSPEEVKPVSLVQEVGGGAPRLTAPQAAVVNSDPVTISCG